MGSSLRHRRERLAFIAVPFIASGVWYVVTLTVLAVVNGRLRARTDVLAMGLGAVTIGVVVAAVATLLLAVPLYWIARRAGDVRLRTALGGGVFVGVLLTVVAWMLEERLWSVLFSPLHGMVGGVATAAAWWHMAGRPGRLAPVDTRSA